MESPTAASPSLPPNKSIFPEQDVSRVALRRHSVDKTSRSGSISLKPTENRELANENNILHKENERKEHRIQALTKEIQSLRVTHTNDQRELKLMANTIDLLKKEKGQLEQERRHSLSKQQQLQHLLDQHQQSKTLLEANERLLKEIDGLKLTISSQQGELLLRKEEIGRLTEELQVAALTIQTQNNYDNAIFYDQLAPTSTSLPVKTNLSLSFGKNREVLKQLYFDLSKKTVNNQSLSEELAATARSHHLLRDTHSQTLTQLQQVREERDRLLLEREEVLRRCEESDRERQALTQRLKDESDAVQQREKQLSELTRRLTEYRVTSEQQRHELGYELTEARKEVQRAEDASQRLRQTIETMSAEEQRLQQLLVETRQLYEEEKKHFLEQQRRLSEEVRALHEVRKRCEEVQVALEQKEVMCQQLQKRCEEVEQEKYEVKGKVSYVSYHLQKERDASAQLQSQYDHLLAAHRKQEQEKEEVLQAFQQLLRTSKELVTQHEEAKREIATLQQRVEEVQAVRENMNSAILNALFDERMKSMISKQMDADAVLKQQLQAQQLPPPHTLPHTLPRQSQQVLLGYATLRTPSEQMEEVEARIARGDFDWLNDDHVIHSVLNESLTQARAMGGVTPAITKETDTSEHERNPILIELEKFQQEISQLHATPTGPPLNTTINNNNNNSNNKDKNASYTSHTSSHSSGSRSQQLPPPPPQPSQPLPHTTTPVNISHMTSHTPPQPSQPSQLSSYSLSYSPYNNTTLLSPPINTTSTNNNPNTTTPQLPPQPLTQLGELPMNNTPINNNNNKLTTPHNTNSGNNSNSSHSYHSQPHQPSGGGGGGGVISNLLDITLASDVTHSRVMEGSGLAMTLTQSKDHSSNSNSTTSHTNSNNSRGSNSSRSNSDVSLVIDQLSEVIATKTSTTNTPHYTTLPQPLPQPLPQHLPSYATTTTYHSRSSSEGELSNNSNTNLTNNSHHSHSTTSSWNLSYLTNPANPVINSNNK